MRGGGGGVGTRCGGGGGVGTWVVVVVCMGTWVVVEQQVEGAGVWTACAPRT